MSDGIPMHIDVNQLAAAMQSSPPFVEMLGKLTELVELVNRYRWQDVVFDVISAEIRESMTEGGCDVAFPLTHRTDPIRHAQYCHRLQYGELPATVDAYALVPLRFEMPVGGPDRYTGDDVDFGTLASTTEALRTVKERAPTALERGIAMLEMATGTKAVRVSMKKKTKKKARSKPAPKAKKATR